MNRIIQKLMKITGITFAVVIGLIVLFIVFMFCSVIIVLHNVAKPNVKSDYVIRQTYKFTFPYAAHHLYYATYGLADRTYYYAFTLPHNDAGLDFMKEYHVDIAQFEVTNAIPEYFLRYGPDSWASKYQDPNWDIQQYHDFRIYDGDAMIIAQAVASNRFFIIYWSGSAMSKQEE